MCTFQSNKLTFFRYVREEAGYRYQYNKVRQAKISVMRPSVAKTQPVVISRFIMDIPVALVDRFCTPICCPVTERALLIVCCIQVV